MNIIEEQVKTANTSSPPGDPVPAADANDIDKTGNAKLDANLRMAIDAIFADFALDLHIPAMAYGIVSTDGALHVGALGLQDLTTRQPATTDSAFRIASMTKVFTALTVLALRDDGKVRLEEPAETYVPEMRKWTYPTVDSPRIRVRDLLNHTAGFVTDDPWGDRQQELGDEAFSQLLRGGVTFASPPGTRMEYSNLGYAILGRIITNVAGRPYAEHIEATLLDPLGMTSSSFDGEASPLERRARGYNWQDDGWTLEPMMTHGAFGAMGGLHTTASDYVQWLRFLLSAWPPRDDPDSGPVRRATIRELAQGSNFPELMPPRPTRDGQERSRRAANYAMGLSAIVDSEFGLHLSHAGGYPGFGSFMLLFPEHGLALFAFANRTYAGSRSAVYDAAALLKAAGILAERQIPVSRDLADAYRTVGTIYAQGDVTIAPEMLAMNFLLDRDAAGWVRDLADLKKKVGNCDTTSPLTAKSPLEGDFTWRGETGRLTGSILLAPTKPPRIQSLTLAVKG